MTKRREEVNEQVFDTRSRSVRTLTVLVTTAALLLGLVLAAGARGPDPERLEDAGWFCFGHGGPATHCLPDGDSVFAGEANSSLIMTWGNDTGEFWGTELLVHEDLYNGQPCPQDLVEGEPTSYIHVTELGLPLPYFVCHHFESPVT